MFVLEIDFRDGVSQSEAILIRRPHAVIGPSESAHVVVEGASSDLPEFSITRGPGTEFICYSSDVSLGYHNGKSFMQDVALEAGRMAFHVTSLEADLMVRPDEALDEAAARILADAVERPIPEFPLLVVDGDEPICFSFFEGETVLVGRSRKCGFRLDAPGIIQEHARFGYSAGQFWVEPVSKGADIRHEDKVLEHLSWFAPGDRIFLGKCALVTCLDDGKYLKKSIVEGGGEMISSLLKFPVAIVRARDIERMVSLGSMRKVIVGKDPTSDVWIQRDEIFPKQLCLQCIGEDKVRIEDLSGKGFITKTLEAVSPYETIDLEIRSGDYICFSKEIKINFVSTFSELEEFLGSEKMEIVNLNKAPFLKDRSDRVGEGIVELTQDFSMIEYFPIVSFLNLKFVLILGMTLMIFCISILLHAFSVL